MRWYTVHGTMLHCNQSCVFLRASCLAVLEAKRFRCEQATNPLHLEAVVLVGSRVEFVPVRVCARTLFKVLADWLCPPERMFGLIAFAKPGAEVFIASLG